MRRHVAALAGLAALGAAALAWAGQRTADDAKAKPGDGTERGVLERFAGHWDYTGTFYPVGEDSGIEPVKMEGSVEGGFLLDSPWLVSRSKGRTGEHAFEVVFIMRYDAEGRKYTMAEASSANFGPLPVTEGSYDEATKTLSWKENESVDASTGARIATRTEQKFLDADTSLETGYVRGPGSEDFVKWYEITVRRRK